MENKINKKLETYLSNYRELIKAKIMDIVDDDDVQNKLLEVLYSFDTLQLEKDDFMKRKRIVSTVALNERCTAKKANGSQCTRKKKCGCNFCGTHDKYQPHGVVSVDLNEKSLTRCTISIVDVNGINYYIDENNNVYDTKDIILNSSKPRIIGSIDKEANKIKLH
tara:strand:+ start:135 stop:629 length:495 start_codon:yes stop_codon:yes gene_type:complete